jgi:hypothetical protein
MSKDMYKALQCFMLEFWDLKQYCATDNATVLQYLVNMPGNGEPWCIHMPDNTRICQVRRVQFARCRQAASRCAV